MKIGFFSNFRRLSTQKSAEFIQKFKFRAKKFTGAHLHFLPIFAPKSGISARKWGVYTNLDRNYFKILNFALKSSLERICNKNSIFGAKFKFFAKKIFFFAVLTKISSIERTFPRRTFHKMFSLVFGSAGGGRGG